MKLILTHLTLGGFLTLWGVAATADETPAPPPEATGVAALSEQYLKRWTPGGDTNAADLPYPHRTAGFQAETDEHWVDGRWQRTLKGPILSHSILLPGYDVGPKQIAVTAGAGKFLLYDLQAGSFVAGVRQGELRTDPARFGLLNRPLLWGDVALFRPRDSMWRQGPSKATVPPTAVDYQGLHLSGERVLFVVRVAGVESLESALPSDDPDAVTSEIQLDARPVEMWSTVSETRKHPKISDHGHAASWSDVNGKWRSVAVNSASPGVRLEQSGDAILLRWPASETPSSARLTYHSGRATEGQAPVNEIAEPQPPQLAGLKRPGEGRWGEPLATIGQVAEKSDMPYVVDSIPPPYDNPFGALFFIAGLAFFPSGDAAICSAHGDVWIVRGLDESLQHVTWQRFATGLYQPLGLEIVDGKVIVLGRDQLTRLHDENGDGEADFYESFNHDLVIQGVPHAYAMRLQRLPDGSLVFLKSGEGPHGSALLKLSGDGQRLDVVARGFRHPFGLGVGLNGEITVADNEGNWVPSSKIDLIQPGGFYGFANSGAEPAEKPLRPLCFLPKVADNSCGGQFWHTSDAWGSYHRGRMFHFSWGRCSLHAVLEQQVGETRQAATVEIPGVRLKAGPGEAEFHPRDGQLYVVGLDGWQTAAEVDGCLQRIRYTGQPVRTPSSFAAHSDGLAIGFDEALDPASLRRKGSIRVEQWNYRWSSTYGSYHYSVADPDRVGHDVVPLEEVVLSADGKQLFLKIAGLKPVDQIQVSLDVRTSRGERMRTNVYGTINALAAPGEPGDPPSGSPLLADEARREMLSRANFVAWCIVPFDARHRTPEERAEMLQRLGIRRIAYDWRQEHVPQFDEELAAYQRHGVTLHAFWTPVNTASPLSEAHWPLILDLLKRHQVQTELWTMIDNSLLEQTAEEARAQRAAEILAPVARAAAECGCQLGLYNHGGWFGDSDNQIAIIEALRDEQIDNVGIVYNFHHGHEHINDFAARARRMAPYLMTVNLNGMRAEGPKILSFGHGDREASMLDELLDAGYRGPLGILGHREERDAEQCLQESIEGLQRFGGSP